MSTADHIANYLNGKKDQVAKLYAWKFNEAIPLERFKITVAGNSWYDKTISLKQQLRRYLTENPDSHGHVADYFIKGWGGIKGFRKSAEVVKSFSHLQGKDQRPAAFNPDFESVSSWSKWAALVCPNWACIYDARVAYSINAINYLNGGDGKIYPAPPGRNTRLQLVDVVTLLLMKKLTKDSSSDPKDIALAHFIEEKNVYVEYLDLVTSVSEKIWGDRSKFHDVEMLLFSLADKEIYSDLFTKVCQANQT